eukprot:scaffold19102_cov172-Amphora_coffeaeformis.AAC.5
MMTPLLYHTVVIDGVAPMLSWLTSFGVVAYYQLIARLEGTQLVTASLRSESNRLGPFQEKGCFCLVALYFFSSSVSKIAPTRFGQFLCNARETPVVSNPDAQLRVIERLSENAIRARGTVDGLVNIKKLSELCAQRLPFHFDGVKVQQGKQQSVISKLPSLLPLSVTKQIFEKVECMLKKGWLSTNPDSVDGLPSFHLNIVSNGKPIAYSESKELDEFQEEIQSIFDLVGPHIYENLLPQVNQQLGTDTIEVSDIFIRRYGQDMLDGKSRDGISAHYDVFSRVTSVVALDDVAREGRNGLFTTAKEVSADGDARTSNHAALRRFFPLSCGDAVVHTWDVLHGVDVEEGIDRTSLIVWFTEKNSSDATVSPWLKNHPHLDSDNVAQFVLASAMESVESTLPSDATERKRNSAQSMHHEISSEKETSSVGLHKAINLYLASALRENDFAMTRLGSLIEEDLLDSKSLAKAEQILDDLQKKRSIEYPSWVHHEEETDNIGLAFQFWYEASIRGNPVAQFALGDEIMASAAHESDARLLAATLFGLAAQQGNEQAQESLTRLVQLDLQLNGVTTQSEFEANTIVQIAQAATMYL